MTELRFIMPGGVIFYKKYEFDTHAANKNANKLQ